MGHQAGGCDLGEGFKVISFDVAGTLLHFARPVPKVYAEVAGRNAIPVDENAVAKRLPEAFRQAGSMAPPSSAEIDRFERQWWRSVLAGSLGVANDDPRLGSCFDELFGYYASSEAWRMHPELLPLLGRLRAEGYRLAICSNFDGRLFPLLQQFDLAACFDAIVLPRHAGSQKPEAGIFHFLVRELGVSPAACLHVGDSVENDAAAARLAGLHGLQWSLKPEQEIAVAEEQLLMALRNDSLHTYATPDVWREAAMARPNGVDDLEAARRRSIARRHYGSEGKPDADTLADHELYILGKMNLDEYQEYLVFKHGKPG